MIAHLSEQPDSTAQTKIYIFILSHSVACLPAFLLNAALAMSLRRRLPTDTHMRAFCVIKVYNALQDDAALINGGNGHLVQPFTFDDTVSTLCNGILKRISTFSHTDADSSVLEFSDVSIAAVLDTSIRVMNKTASCLAVYCRKGHLERPHRIGCLEGWPKILCEYASVISDR